MSSCLFKPTFVEEPPRQTEMNHTQSVKPAGGRRWNPQQLASIILGSTGADLIGAVNTGITTNASVLWTPQPGPFDNRSKCLRVRDEGEIIVRKQEITVGGVRKGGNVDVIYVMFLYCVGWEREIRMY